MAQSLGMQFEVLKLNFTTDCIFDLGCIFDPNCIFDPEQLEQSSCTQPVINMADSRLFLTGTASVELSSICDGKLWTRANSTKICIKKQLFESVDLVFELVAEEWMLDR